MTETSTPSDVARDVIEHEREQHAVIMRVVADMHAAYGKGVNLDIIAPVYGPSTLTVSNGKDHRTTLSFWDDGEVYMAVTGHETIRLTRVEALAVVREFIHRHGHGAR